MVAQGRCNLSWACIPDPSLPKLLNDISVQDDIRVNFVILVTLSNAGHACEHGITCHTGWPDTASSQPCSARPACSAEPLHGRPVCHVARAGGGGCDPAASRCCGAAVVPPCPVLRSWPPLQSDSRTINQRGRRAPRTLTSHLRSGGARLKSRPDHRHRHRRLCLCSLQT